MYVFIYIYVCEYKCIWVYTYCCDLFGYLVNVSLYYKEKPEC